MDGRIRTFGQVIRQRRRQLDLTQEEVARKIKTSAPYVGLLETGKRHPSRQVIVKLANILGSDARDLFLSANPKVSSLVYEEPESELTPAWDAFVKDEKLRNIHNITGQEIEMLSRVAMMGQVRSPRDFIFILQAVRQALGR